MVTRCNDCGGGAAPLLGRNDGAGFLIHAITTPVLDESVLLLLNAATSASDEYVQWRVRRRKNAPFYRLFRALCAMPVLIVHTFAVSKSARQSGRASNV